MLVALCGVAALAATSVAGAAPAKCKLLVPGRSLACVSVGMSQAQVRAAAGKPVEVAKATGCCGQILTFTYHGFGVSFLASHGTFRRIGWVVTTSRLYRTATGVGVGSTRAQLLAGVKGVRCGAFGLAKGFCVAGKALDDPRQTLFMLRNGRVAWVRLGFQPE